MSTPFAPDWLIRRINQSQVESHAPLLSGRLLDVGCGLKPYESILREYVEEYIGLEHPDTPHHRDKVDVWGTAERLPFDDCTFDSYVAFQVLEHVEEPSDALAEAFRVLRPGGVAFITTPFLWGIHEAPRDFYRYTPYGLEHLTKKAGFEATVVEPVGGYWLTTGVRLAYHLDRYRRRRTLRPFVGLVQWLSQLLGAAFDKASYGPDDAPGYVTLARRPR